ncbi:heavy-metal-associated domain-containing protein [Humidisolicoccus flavus]|uniref:heavy-metal-associated domain-containing protein n=1 Tax=Humidisolicoccus flavus TaxID=3111414 RepID=UPI003253F41A
MTQELPLLGQSSADSCCGGGCCGGGDAKAAAPVDTERQVVSTIEVTGMTCDHCETAVTKELLELEGVSTVSVSLNPEGVSIVQVTSDAPLQQDQIAAAIDEAGYELAR